MNRSRQCLRLLVPAVALLCVLTLPSAAHAEPIMLNPTITNLGNGLFSYQYSVTNTAPFGFSTVSILNLPTVGNAVQNLMAPAGFNAFFDPGLGELDFVEDTQSFAAGSTVSGFSFISPFAPGVTIFTALRLDENFNPITVQGTVLAPQNAPAAVPEPATLMLLATGLAGIAAKVRRRRNGMKNCGNPTGELNFNS